MNAFVAEVPVDGDESRREQAQRRNKGGQAFNLEARRPLPQQSIQF